MKLAYNFLFAVLCAISMVSMFAVATDEAAAVAEADESPLRQLVRGRSSALVDTDEVDDEEDERELGRVKARYQWRRFFFQGK